MMRKIYVEVIGSEPDSDVIRTPNRSYPGILIQGDSLVALLSSANEAIEYFEKDKEESLEAMKFIRDELCWRFEYYKRVLDENGSPFGSKSGNT